MLMKLTAGNKELQDLMTCMFQEVDLRKKLANPRFYLQLLFGRLLRRPAIRQAKA